MAKPQAHRPATAVPQVHKPEPKPQASARAEAPGVNGVAYTVQASKDQGFSNFRICILFIVDGEIVHVERTQEYAAFEAIARLEVLVNSSIWNLSSRYQPGAIQGMGGDHRDELVNRLKKSNPELLRKIAPALGLKLDDQEDGA